MCQSLHVAAIQQTCCSDSQTNRQKTSTMIEEAVRNGAQLVVLQELHNSLYFCQTESVDAFELAEPIPGSSTEFYSSIARSLQVVIVTSLFERRAPGLYHNTAVVFERDGSQAGQYRKMHIPDDPGFYEKFYFTPGDLGFAPIDTSVGRLGVLVCWDQWYPEAARLMCLAGAELLIYPTAIGWDPDDDAPEKERQRDAWFTVQRAHAIANGVPLISVNRTGFEPAPDGERHKGIDFWGYSFICGPQGEVLNLADEREQILNAVIDQQRSEHVRRIWPFLRDRRIDAYSKILLRYRD
ncbi:carbon-nitrogen hydrolase [Desulfurispira natronophila]|uniref:N-carbamoylputrescine amidase n=1 Tax=Desulfurispira natronophila TaxID=682562 RepID=A0A7W7Y349_9BACT|nr:carbon-nitrogen hydrolase [Desulfurispira natronophila]MBB5020922.1 N-carbamoylputrescine amidase [Desulfurispira natronophila]